MTDFKNKVLVVEDDLALQPFWQSVLKKCYNKLDLAWAISGEEAKLMVQKANASGDPYELVISDIFLAGSETGLDLMGSQELAQSHANFILVSVAEEEKVKDHFTHIVNNGTVMTKPLKAPECERTINEMIIRRAS